MVHRVKRAVPDGSVDGGDQWRNKVLRLTAFALIFYSLISVLRVLARKIMASLLAGSVVGLGCLLS
jgi:hypothetical protein